MIDLNMREGTLWDKILWYAIPLALTGILQQLFNAADIAVVGRFVGANAMAAVGSNTPLINLLLNLFVGISLGTNVVIANAIGRKDADTVRKAVHTSVIISVAGGFVVTVTGELIAAPALRMMGVPAEVFDLALLYFRIYIAGVPIILLYNFTAAIYRSEGNTRMPLVVLFISGIVNVILNLFFVVTLGRSVDGVAIATVLSNLISAVILIIGLVRSEGVTRIRLSDLKVNRKVLIRIVRIGIPSGVQGMAFSAANIVIQASVNSLGAVVMAGSSAAFNLELFAFYILNAFGQACTTFVGQNNGAGKKERCTRSLLLCLGESAVFTALICVLILYFGRSLLAFFNGDPEVIEAGYIRLIYIFGAYCFSFMVEVFSGYLRGYGISLFPAIVSLAGISGIRIVWIYTIFRKNHTFSSIMAAYPVSMLATAAALFCCIVLLHPWKDGRNGNNSEKARKN